MPGGETTKYWLSQTGLELLATHEWRVLAFQIHKHFGLKLAFQIWFFSCLQPATGQFCQWTLMWEFQLTFGFGRSPEANQVYDWEFNDRMRLGCNKTTSITNSIEKINVFNFSRSFFFLDFLPIFGWENSFTVFGRLPLIGGLWDFCREDHPYRSCGLGS